MDRTCWYAIRTKPHAEQAVARTLASRGVEVFLPLYKRRTQWSDRARIQLYPLFPSYVFCRIDLSRPGLKIVQTPGVLSFVSISGDPLPIPDEQIEAVTRILDSNRFLIPTAVVRPGQRVRIASGTLAGLTGIVSEIRSKQFLIVHMPFLNRSVAVQLDGDAIAVYA